MTIYVFDIRKLNNEDIAICQNHFPKRFEKAQSFHFDNDKKRCYAGAVLMNKVLGITEKDLLFGENQKPMTNGVSFNISHSGDFVVLAKSDCPIGIDIEKVEDFKDNVSKRVFTANEQNWLKEDEKQRFYQLWTLKESVMKATGKGLSLAPNSFDVLPFFDKKEIIINGIFYYGMVTKLDNYYISLCQTKPIDKVDIAYNYDIMRKD